MLGSIAMGFIRITAAAILIVGAGIVHGAWTGRWGPSAELAELAARYDSVPTTIGDWRATPFELGDRERRMAGAAACLARVYTNAARGVSVSVLLLGGLPGNITTHTPDICYGSSGFELTTPEAFRYAPGGDGPALMFRTAMAVRRGAKPSALRIFWSWRGKQGWAAPDNARWEFASQAQLSKLYVVRETGGAVVEPDRDPCKDFLDVLLPELDRAVFAPAG
jgi:uncharacterized protein DUF3485